MSTLHEHQRDYVLRTVEERGIRLVRLWFTDVLGNLKSFAISPAEMENALNDGMSFDGSSIDGYSRVQESDVLAIPDANTFEVLPWADAKGAEREQLQAELDGAVERIAELEAQLKVLLLPADPNDGKNIIVEIRGAEGGEEANLFAHDLFDMYSAWALRNGWSVEVMSLDKSPMGGINQVTMLFKGDTVWTRMRFEGGPHRVQRVPATESQGRIHTSAASVAVLPEAV